MSSLLHLDQAALPTLWEHAELTCSVLSLRRHQTWENSDPQNGEQNQKHSQYTLVDIHVKPSSCLHILPTSHLLEMSTEQKRLTTSTKDDQGVH